MSRPRLLLLALTPPAALALAWWLAGIGDKSWAGEE